MENFAQDRLATTIPGGAGALSTDLVPSISLLEPAMLFSPRPVNQFDAAAVTLQKVYKSFRTRSKLADCAVVVEELWWKALDFAALRQISVSFFSIEKHETAASRWARASAKAARVGKGLSKDKNAKILAFQHWLEAIDPRHRYGHNLHMYYNIWFDSESTQPFFYWLDVGDGKEVNLKSCPRSCLQQQCIKYLGPKEREAYEVIVVNGKLVYKQTGLFIETPECSKWIFVLSTSRTLYVGQKKKRVFQHSSFLSGGATTAAGRLVAHDGVLEDIRPYSCHYLPTKDNFQEFISFLKEHNVDLTNLKSDDAYPSFRDSSEEPKPGPVPSLAPNTQSEEDATNNSYVDVAVEEASITTDHQEDMELVDANVQAPFDLAKRLSCKWSTGAGPRFACVWDYPVEPSALPGGGEIVGPIALSSSEFASTNNKAQRVGQDKSGSAASNSKKKRTREQEDREEINTSITLDDLRQHYGRKRKDVAESLGVSVSTLKRTCRQYGIKRWPNIIRKKAWRHPDQHGENNPSPICMTLSTKGQTEMENEIVEGPNEAGVSSECEFQLKNQWSQFSAYPNSDGPVVPHPHITSTQIQGENMGSLGDWRNLFASLEEPLLQMHVSGSMWTVPPCLDQAPSRLMPTIAHTTGSSDDLRNLLPSVEEPFSAGHVSGSIDWTIPPCSVPAPSQPMPTIAHPTGSSDDLRNLLPMVEEPFSAGHVSGRSFFGGTCFWNEEAGVSSESEFQLTNQWSQFSAYPNSDGPVVPHPHITSTQILGENMGSLGDWRNLFASLEEPILQMHVSGSMRTVPPCLDQAPSRLMPTIAHTTGSSDDLLPLVEEPFSAGHVSGSKDWTIPPCSVPALSQPMPTIAHTGHTMESSDDLRNLLPMVEEPFSAGHVFGSIDWTVPPCSVPASSQPMPTIAHTTGSSDDLRNLPMVGEPFSAGHVSGSIDWTVPPCSVPAPSLPMPTIAHTTGSSDDLRNLLALVEEPFSAGQVSGSVSWTVPSCFDPALSQLLPTIPHPMPTIPRMMPLLTERQDTRSVKLRATYGDTTIKFNLPLTSGISELNKEVLKRLELELGRFRVEYEDEDGVLILIACDEDVRDYLQFLTSSGNQVFKPLVLKKVPNTANVCETYESLKRKRQ